MGSLSKKKQMERDLDENLCCNPLRKRRCGKADIEVYLIYRGQRFPICHSCWGKLAKKDWTEEDSKEEFVYEPLEGLDESTLERKKK